MHHDPGLLFPPPDVIKQRMMVAEFVGRGQSGSPIDGELPHLNSNMPSSNGIMSPNSPEEDYPPGYNHLSNHLKHKDLFSQRKQREFIPDNKKDESYWDRRRRNNEAAKRSREKRRFNDMVLEQRVVELTKENYLLKAQLDAIKEEYGICGENLVCVDKVLASLPSNDQVLSMTKRQKVSNSPQMIFSPSPSPIPTSVIHQPVMGSPPPTQMHPHAHLHPPPSNNDHPYPESNEFYSYPPFHSAAHFDSGNSVLNLSRSRSRVQSPFEVSSNSGDESVPVPLVVGSESNNSLPLKLRHKSHLGDKDAASALLSLQHIKQEPAPTISPRSWDGENSCDDRDSGISIPSIGHQEWSATAAAAATLQSLQKSHMAMRDQGDSEAKNRLHSEIVRLSSEVEHLKSIMCRKSAKQMAHSHNKSPSQ